MSIKTQPTQLKGVFKNYFAKNSANKHALIATGIALAITSASSSYQNSIQFAKHLEFDNPEDAEFQYEKLSGIKRFLYDLAISTFGFIPFKNIIGNGILNIQKGKHLPGTGRILGGIVGGSILSSLLLMICDHLFWDKK